MHAMKETIKVTTLMREAKEPQIKVVSSYANPETRIENTDLPPGFEEIKIDYMDVNRINISKIEDTQGRICDTVSAVEIETGLCMIPFSVLKLSNNVVSIKDHSIVYFKGEKYSMSKNVREDVINEWKTKIYNKISSGLEFREELTVIGKYNDKSFETCVLSDSEITMLASLYANSDPKVFVNQSTGAKILIVTGRQD